jgi:Flp pilus assembly protein TadD
MKLLPADLSLGLLAAEREQLGAAKEAISAAVRTDPRNREAQIAVSGVLADTQDFSGAERLLRELLREDPDNAQAYPCWGAASVELGRYEEARKACEKALALDSECLNREPEWPYRRRCR